jgi:hypothetical protein
MCVGIDKDLVEAAECVSPAGVPWLPFDHCFHIFEFRTFRLPNLESVEIRVKYDHALCMKGRKQGPLAYTVTLLPQEEMTLYHYERHRRVNSASAQFSQRTSFYEFSQKVHSRFTSDASSATDDKTSASGSASAGGGFITLGFVGLGGGSASMSASSASHHTAVSHVGQTFENTAVVTAQAVESERSIVVSTFEEKDTVDTTKRVLRNDNNCRAVTYFVRRVFEVYVLTTTIVSIEARLRGGDFVPIESLPDALAKEVKKAVEGLVKIGDRFQAKQEIFLPTDGLVYEPELAHCCSCEPEREKQHFLENQKLEIEIALMAQEVERRKALVAKGELGAFDPCCPGDEA